MTNVIILHGKPDEWEFYDPAVPMVADDHWYPWLQKQLLIKDVEAMRPQVSRAFEAKYEDWVREVEHYDINENTILVGHSCGGGFFLRYLSENPLVRIKKLILVAPWLDPLKFMPKTFGFDLFEFERDPQLFDRVDEHVVFHSDDDMESIQLTLAEVKQTWPHINIREFHERQHFCDPEFPELLEEVQAGI